MIILINWSKVIVSNEIKTQFLPPSPLSPVPPLRPISVGGFLQTSSFSLHGHWPEAETETSPFESEKYQVKPLILSLYNVFHFPLWRKPLQSPNLCQAQFLFSYNGEEFQSTE